MDIDRDQLQPVERKIYEQAQALVEQGVDASAFSSRIFGPESEMARLGQTERERRQLLASPLYRWLKQRYEELRARDAARFERDLKPLSGRLTVVVPKSLHAALKSEAASEGVSLAELMRLKLNVPYRQMARLLLLPNAG
ncbi:MAG: toxin-antitoxin system HicB family antitoxin [Thermoanaerobaculia bacterium]|nr:toxin-antitoxin system HicB family antitoxin [Thermoanaerobaculia bacterium]